MEKFNVVRAKKYQVKGSQEEKTVWLPVGTITKFDNGNQLLELNDRQETYQIFPFKDKEEKVEQKDVPQDDVVVSKIPF